MKLMRAKGERDISSLTVGGWVMDELRDLDAKPDILRRAGFTMIRARSFFLLK